MDNDGKEEIFGCSDVSQDDRSNHEARHGYGHEEAIELEDIRSHDSDEDMEVNEEDGSHDENMIDWHAEEYGSHEDRNNWYGDQTSAFEQIYQCYPPIYIDRPELEKANRIIMPPSALSRLISREMEYPMLFQLENTTTGRISHCGVVEFVAEEGIIYMPLWMMENMLLQAGDTVKLKHTVLPKGTFLKLQPHTKNFLDIFNPRAVLEVSLRSFSCLTTGDTIKIDYNSNTYCFDIVETKPESAISVFDTDLEVDFATPLDDFKEPESVPVNHDTITSAREQSSMEGGEEPQCIRFTAFSGVGRRLDGKAVSPKVKSFGGPRSRSPSRPPIRKPGKLVFGHNSIKIQSTESGKEAAQKSEEADKFKPFTGRKYSLRD